MDADASCVNTFSTWPPNRATEAVVPASDNGYPQANSSYAGQLGSYFLAQEVDPKNVMNAPQILEEVRELDNMLLYILVLQQLIPSEFLVQENVIPLNGSLKRKIVLPHAGFAYIVGPEYVRRRQQICDGTAAS